MQPSSIRSLELSRLVMTVQIECFVRVCVLLKYMSGVLQINVWALIVRTWPGTMSFG